MPAARQRTDDRLVAAFRAGDDGAFAAIDARYRPLLERYARRLLGSQAHVVEDVVQEALLRASRALRRDERQMLLKPWLHRLVRNCCLDELSRVRTDSVELTAADSAGLLVAADDAGLIERRRRVRELLVDLAALPDLQRHALVRREVDGLSHEQLATELDLSVSATKSLVFRARANLAKLGLARAEPCDDVQRALLAAHDAQRRASAHVYRHIAGCRDCRGMRRRLVATRRGLVALSPAPWLLGVAALAGKEVAGGALTTKVAAGGAAGALVVVGGLGIGTHVFRSGDPAPLAIRSAALPGGTVTSGDPLPGGTAVVLRKVSLAAGTTHHPRLVLTCPAGLTIADLLPPHGTRLSVTYDPSSIVGSSRRATLVFERRALARAAAVTVGTLCKATDRRGSVVAGTAPMAQPGEGVSAGAARKTTRRPADRWAHVSVPHADLQSRPGGASRGSLRSDQPVWVLRRTRGWREVVADTGERGWVRAAQLGA